MSDPNAPRREGQHDPADQPAEGFSVTDEQHAAPSAPAAPGTPGVGQPAQSFTAPAGDAAPGQPAFGATPGDEPAVGQDWQHGQHQPEGSHLGQPSAPQAPPAWSQPGQGASAPQQPGGYAQPGGPQQPFAQPGSAPVHGAPGQQGAGYGQPGYGQPQPGYGQPQPGQPQYGAPGQPQYATSAPMSPVDEKNAGMWGHLSGLSTIVTGGFGGWIGPLIVYMIYKDRSAFAKQESKEALNFGIFMTILAVGLIVIGTLTSIIGIGFLLLGIYWVPALLQVIFSIIGAMRVNGGGSYRYPFNWRMVK